MFLIANQSDKDKACAQIQGWNKPMWLSSSTEAPKRSLAQCKLAERWYNEIAEHSENGRVYERNMMRLTFGVPILLASELKMSEGFRDVWNHGLINYSFEYRLKVVGVIAITSLMGIKEMTEYLHAVEVDSSSKGFVLSKPDEYKLAMGEK